MKHIKGFAINPFLKIYILNWKDKSIENILRNIIFNPNNQIDWNDVLYQMYANMPELTK